MNNLRDATPEVVHARGEEDARAAYPGGATALRHPVPVEALHEAHGVRGDFGGLVAEFEERGEARDVVRGVDEREAQVEGLDELEVGVAEFEYVDLELIG